MPCPNKRTVRSYLTPEEHETVSRMASAAGLSVSTFMRKVCLGHEIKTFEHEELKLELIKARSDLGRVGGLLKAGLGLHTQTPEFSAPEVRRLLNELTKLQRGLSEAVSKL